MRMSRFLLLFALIPLLAESAARPCLNGSSANKFDCKEVSLQGRVGLNQFPGQPLSASSLWGYSDPDDNREYAIVGLRNGVGVVEVTDPIKPRIVGHISGVISLWREVKVYSVKNTKTKKWDVIGNTLYLAHYSRGLVIMDVTNPLHIREIKFFDTYPKDDSHPHSKEAHHPGGGENAFHGAWGVYPFLPSGNVLISDLERGLFILKPQ